VLTDFNNKLKYCQETLCSSSWVVTSDREKGTHGKAFLQLLVENMQKKTKKKQYFMGYQRVEW